MSRGSTRYETWVEFRKELSKQIVCDLSSRMWEFLRQELLACAIHEPFSDGDIPFALQRIKSIKQLSRVE